MDGNQTRTPGSAMGDFLLSAFKTACEASHDWIECEDIGSLVDPVVDLRNNCSEIVKQGVIRVHFPGNDDPCDWPVNDFMLDASECDQLEAGESVTLRTPSRTLQLVMPVNDKAIAVNYNRDPLKLETDEVTVRLTYQSLALGVYACSIGAFHKKHSGPMDIYMAIEIEYKNPDPERVESEEVGIIDAYLFELASSHGIIFRKSDFIFYDDEDELINELPEIKLRALQPINEGIRLYLAAAQVDDPALRFFSFYKVLEHFAPTVLNLEAHDSLRKKLDGPAALAPDGRFIREIFQMAKGFDQRKNDREMIRGVLSTCIDLPSINDKVPAFLRKPITYESQVKESEAYCRDLAECISATRNQVGHAKANYSATGTECPAEELPGLIEFLEQAAAQTIRWYNRLPDHQKSELA